MGKIVYVRMNIVEAVEMSRKEYCESRGWELPANEDPNERVMMVTYSDGYVSMCPKVRFLEVSIGCEEGHTTFGYAITECRYHGKRIRRANWNGEGQFVRYEDVLAFTDGKIHATGSVALPVGSSCFVFHFKNRHTGETGIQVGWLASQADMAASDWIVED